MQVYLVGGAVRDQLLGLEIKERDWVVVGASVEEMLSLGYKQVGKDFPVIEGYSEGEVKLTASANLLAGIRFVGDMMQSQGEPIAYEFKAKLDLGGLYPSIRISESGELDLGSGGRRPQDANDA